MDAAARPWPARFRVAFSFAGAQRDQVRAVAEAMEASLGRGSVFYDDWFVHVIAGLDADLVLQDLYTKRTDLVVACIAKAYDDRAWTKVEFRAIRAMAMEWSASAPESRALLPLRFGPGDVEGLPANTIIPDQQGQDAGQTAALILARLALLTPPAAEAAPPPAPAPPARPAASVALPVDALIDEVLSGDPLRAAAAAAALKGCAEAWMAILHRDTGSGSAVTAHHLRELLMPHGEAAAMLADRVLNADHDWGPALRAASLLHPAHAPQVEDRLGERFDRAGHLVRRLIPLALGHLGATGWGWNVVNSLRQRRELDGDDVTLLPYLLKGCAWMFVQERGDSGVRLASQLVLAALALAGSRAAMSEGDMRQALARIGGDQADRLISDWLGHATPRVRELAAQALGDAHLQRATTPLTRLLEDTYAGVARAAAFALASLDSPRACAAVQDHAAGSGAMAMLLHHIADEAAFRDAAETWIEGSHPFRWAALRSLGRRRAAWAADALREAAAGTHSLERGSALLALARIGAPQDRGLIEAGVHESSSDTFEKAFALLAWALVAPDCWPAVEPELRAALAQESLLYWPALQRDVVDTLEALPHAGAKALAAGWRPFYRMRDTAPAPPP